MARPLILSLPGLDGQSPTKCSIETKYRREFKPVAPVMTFTVSLEQNLVSVPVSRFRMVMN